METPCQCRGHGFDPWHGMIPHAVEQLNLSPTTTEAHAPRARALQKKSHLSEKTAPEASAATGKSPHAATKTQGKQKEINRFLKSQSIFS